MLEEGKRWKEQEEFQKERESAYDYIDLSKRLRERTTIAIPNNADAILAPPDKQLPTIPYNKDEATAYLAQIL